MTRTLLTLAGCVLAVACFDPVQPNGPGEPAPFLEYLNVDAAFGETGRTFVGWSHPQGPLAITNQPVTMRFTIRTASGESRAETVATPFDTRSPTPNIIEHEYRFGRDLMEIRATQQDDAGRVSVYECFAPDWECYRQ